MTVYARSDIMGVSLSLDHGGCGATHTRPVSHGAPIKVWGLDCLKCENHLRHDPRWAANPVEIPETPDEVKLREDKEKKGKFDHEANLEASIASLAATSDGIQKLLSVMIASQANSNPAMVQALKVLSGQDVVQETENTPPAAEYYAPDIAEIPNLKVPADPIPEAPLETLPDADLSPEFATLPIKDLREMARERNLPDTGTRAQLIDRLTEKV